MAHILIKLSLKDYSAWKPVFDDFGKVRATSGSRGGQLYRLAENSNEVYVLWQWDSLDNARKFFASPELRAAMQTAGVNGPPVVYYLDEVERVTV